MLMLQSGGALPAQKIWQFRIDFCRLSPVRQGVVYQERRATDVRPFRPCPLLAEFDWL